MKNSRYNLHEKSREWMKKTSQRSEGSRQYEPTVKFNECNLNFVSYSQELLCQTKKFLKANGPYDIKVANKDKLYTKFKTTRLEILYNRNKNTFEKKLAEEWLEKNQDYVESKIDSINLRRRKSVSASEKSEGPKNKNIRMSMPLKTTSKTNRSKTTNNNKSGSSYAGSSASGLSDFSESESESDYVHPV